MNKSQELSLLRNNTDNFRMSDPIQRKKAVDTNINKYLVSPNYAQVYKLYVKSVKNEYKDILRQELNDKCLVYTSAMNNIYKNRYKNILANENTRVVLNYPKNYINANHISYQESKFIATQAPLINTMADFYDMIWQNQSSIIITLTDIVEKGNKKMDIYWPSCINKVINVGIYNITYESEKIIEEQKITIRKFNMTIDGIQFKNLTQIHYTGWPDCDVPNNPNDIINIYRLMKHFENQTGNNPTIVHCSAGIGRTGTFITLSICLNIINDMFKNSEIYSFSRNNINKNLNIKKLLMEIRKQRTGLVQTWRQYLYIYECVNFYLSKYPF